MVPVFGGCLRADDASDESENMDDCALAGLVAAPSVVGVRKASGTWERMRTRRGSGRGEGEGEGEAEGEDEAEGGLRSEGGVLEMRLAPSRA